MKGDFEKETKWCESCNEYQRYMMSIDHSYCAECGSKVRLFSKTDAEKFGEELTKRRWRGTGS